MPSAYRIHGTTPNGDKRLQCKSCRKTFSLGSSRRRQKETTETTLVLKLLVNQTGLKRITEITGIPATRLYNRIDFLAEQCRYLANHKERNIAKEFAGRNRVIATDVQTLLANWRHADRILNVPVQHAASVERDTGYALAATTDYDPDTDPIKMEQQMSAAGDFLVPRAWRKHGRVWSFEEYQDSVLRGVGNILSEEEQRYYGKLVDLPGSGTRVRGDVMQIAHAMLVKKLIGTEFRLLLYCTDGSLGLAETVATLYAREVQEGRAHVADIRFAKGLGNRKRELLRKAGDDEQAKEELRLAPLIRIARDAYRMTSDITALTAARLLEKYGLAPVGDRGEHLSRIGFYWAYHRKEEPEKHIQLITDRGDLDFGRLAIMLTRASMAPVDKYFGLIRARISGFVRGSRPTSGDATWYRNAYYDPEMIEKMTTIFRFYYNFMLPESADSNLPKEKRRTPAMKLGIAKGLVYPRDVLSF